MARWSTILIVAVAVLALTCDAYKSVRHKRPQTDIEKEQHHLFHRRRPEKPLGHDNEKSDHEEPEYHKSKSYHRQFGTRNHGFNKNHKSHKDEFTKNTGDRSGGRSHEHVYK
jgi:hypothetical protein